VRRVVEARRAKGEKVGLVKVKLFRPFLRQEFAKAIGSAKRVGVLDRNHSPGSGGIFWNEIATSLRSRRMSCCRTTWSAWAAATCCRGTLRKSSTI